MKDEDWVQQQLKCRPTGEGVWEGGGVGSGVGIVVYFLAEERKGWAALLLDSTGVQQHEAAAAPQQQSNANWGREALKKPLNRGQGGSA